MRLVAAKKIKNKVFSLKEGQLKRLSFSLSHPLIVAFGVGLVSSASLIFGWGWLSLFALLGLVSFMMRPPPTFLSGLAFGFGWFAISSFLIADVMYTHSNLGFTVSVLLFFLALLVFSFWFGVWFKVFGVLHTRTSDFLWLFPSLACVQEWVRTWFLDGIPIQPISHILVASPFSSLLSVVGGFGAVFLLFASLAAISLIYSEGFKRAYIAVLLLTCAFSLPADVHLEGEGFKMALVQPDHSAPEKWLPDMPLKMAGELVALSSLYGGADVILWPEDAIAAMTGEFSNVNDLIAEVTGEWDAILVSGAITRVGEYYQSSMVMRQSDAWVSVGKTKLVQFSEYTPSFVPFDWRLFGFMPAFVPYEGSGVLHLKFDDGRVLNVGSVICSDGIFPSVAFKRVSEGADVIFVISNLGWFDSAVVSPLFGLYIRSVALENGVYVAAAINNGESMFVSPDGVVVSSLGEGEGVLEGSVSKVVSKSIYQSFGAMPVIVFSFFVILWFVFLAGRARLGGKLTG